MYITHWLISFSSYVLLYFYCSVFDLMDFLIFHTTKFINNIIIVMILYRVNIGIGQHSRLQHQYPIEEKNLDWDTPILNYLIQLTCFQTSFKKAEYSIEI